MNLDREELFKHGKTLMQLMIDVNRMPPVKLTRTDGNHRTMNRMQAIGLYSSWRAEITICVEKCSRIGYGPRAWSYPGYISDRTPFGVLQHELGHHWHANAWQGMRELSSDFKRAARGEQPTTSYAPNVGEDIAESFRLFTTNPTLMAAYRPRRFEFLARYLTPVRNAHWSELLAGSPRHVKAAERKAAQQGVPAPVNNLDEAVRLVNRILRLL